MIDSSWIKLGRPWPSLNELLTIHWRKRSQWKDYFRQRGRVELQVRMIQIPEPLDRYVANIEFMRVGPKELDFDNLYGGLKVVVDGLKAKRIIIYGRKPLRKDGYPERIWGLYADDNKKFLNPKVDQLTTSKETDFGTYIRIAWREIENGKRTSSKTKSTAP